MLGLGVLGRNYHTVASRFHNNLVAAITNIMRTSNMSTGKTIELFVPTISESALGQGVLRREQLSIHRVDVALVLTEVPGLQGGLRGGVIRRGALQIVARGLSSRGGPVPGPVVGPPPPMLTPSTPDNAPANVGLMATT